MNKEDKKLKVKSMAGYLGKKYGYLSGEEILRELQEERRKSDRF